MRWKKRNKEENGDEEEEKREANEELIKVEIRSKRGTMRGGEDEQERE